MRYYVSTFIFTSTVFNIVIYFIMLCISIRHNYHNHLVTLCAWDTVPLRFLEKMILSKTIDSIKIDDGPSIRYVRKCWWRGIRLKRIDPSVPLRWEFFLSEGGRKMFLFYTNFIHSPISIWAKAVHLFIWQNLG